jgi:WD40 repeat protein/tRNA A-37 threonylcarbamoyl transferase component Bud32
MTDPAFQRVMRIFEEACRLPPMERPAFLDAACAGEPSLRTEVEDLLACDADADTSFLTAGAGAQLLAEHVAGHTPRFRHERPAVLGGKYRLIRPIGHGGMGEVFEAEQSVPRRRVAIKLMRPGLSSAGALRRFEHEAHVLGRLQHPGIAQIYEVGAVSPLQPDDVFFAMELIDGLPVDRFAEAAGSSTAEKLELVAKIADALQHAHQRGVIHRDLKPANILVEPSGQPKVLDFGVARVANDDSLLSRSLTAEGQIIGTLAYMSPEQVAGDPAHIDVRADVYAIGVILYQLLARRLPIDPGSRSIPETLRMITQDDPPSLGSFGREFRGDIETIVRKSLEKDPARRYQSAADFADDLRRTLRGEPILARQHSAIYVTRKLIRRHPVVTAALSVAAIGLASLVIFANLQADRFRELARVERELRMEVEGARAESDRLRGKADDAARSLREELRRSNIERGRLFARTGTLAPAEDLLWPIFLEDPDNLDARYGLREAYRSQGLLATIPVSTDDLTALATRRDGSLVAGDNQGGLFLLDPQRRSVTRQTTLPHPVVGIDASAPDVIAVALANGSLLLIDPQSLATLPVAAVPSARAIAVSPAGNQIACAAPDRTVVVRQLPTLIEVWRSEADTSIPHTIAWSPDGTELASAGNGLRIHIWRPPTDESDPPSAAPIASLEGHTGGIATLAWSEDGATLWSGSSDRTVRRWDRRSGNATGRWRYANGTIRHAILARNAETMIAAGWWSIDRLDARSGERLASVSPGSGATGLARLPEGGIDGDVASAHSDGTVRLWSFDPSAGRVPLPTREGVVRGTSSRSIDRPLVALGDSAGTIDVYDGVTGTHIPPQITVGSAVRAISFARDDTAMVVVSGDGRLLVVNRASGAVERSAPLSTEPLATILDVAADGERILVGLRNGMARIYRLKDLSIEREAPMGVGSVTGVRFTPSGDGVAAIGRTRAVTRRDLALMETARFDDPIGTPWAPAFRPDGRLVATGTWGLAVHLFDAESLAPHAVLVGHRALPWLVQFDPIDLRLLHSGGEDGQLNTWNVMTTTLLSSVRPFAESDLSTLSVSIDGRRALVASSLGEAAILDLDYDDRAVAGNVEYAIRRYGTNLPSATLERVRSWVRSVR